MTITPLARALSAPRAWLHRKSCLTRTASRSPCAARAQAGRILTGTRPMTSWWRTWGDQGEVWTPRSGGSYRDACSAGRECHGELPAPFLRYIRHAQLLLRGEYLLPLSDHRTHSYPGDV